MGIQNTPQYRHSRSIALAGIMRIYDSQADATAHIPEQWQELLGRRIPEVEAARVLYGASPCTGDHRIHYLAGFEAPRDHTAGAPDRLTLEEGEYAVFMVAERSQLRDTWVWALREWLPASGRRERQAPEFELYTAPYDAAQTSGPIEIWIPLAPQN